MSSDPPKRVLIVDDETFIRILLTDHFEEAGYIVMEASDGQEALDLLTLTEIDLLVSDVRMPGERNGFDLASWAKEHRPKARVILMSGYYGEEDIRQETEEHEFIRKPFQPKQVIALAKKVLES